MTVDLSENEIEIIESWYLAAAGESKTDCDNEMFALLEKLSIHASSYDLYQQEVDTRLPEYQDELREKNAAIQAYCERHPDYEEVQEARD